MLKGPDVAVRRSLAARRPPPTASAFAWRLGFCDSPLKGGVIFCSLDKDRDHSPLEGESARGRSPQSSRRGANAAPRK